MSCKATYYLCEGQPIHLRIYGFDQVCLWGQCEAVPLVSAAGGLEREHNIQSRGEWEGSGTLKLTKTVTICCTVGGLLGNSVFFMCWRDMFDCKVSTQKRKKKKLKRWTVISDSISPKDNKAHEAVRQRATPWGQRPGSRLVFTAAQYSVSSVVAVAPTTQITGPVWHGHTPRSGYTHTPEACWSSSPQQVLSPLLQGNVKPKTSGACLSKWCDLRQGSSLSRLHTPASEEREGGRGTEAGRGGRPGRPELGLCSSVSAVWLGLLWAFERRGQALRVPKGNVDHFLLFYCWRIWQMVL